MKYQIKIPPYNMNVLNCAIGEFELESDSVAEAREIAKNKIPSDTIAAITQWSDKWNKFEYPTHKHKHYVHECILFQGLLNNKGEIVTLMVKGKCRRDIPSQGMFLSEDDAKRDFEGHSILADEKLDEMERKLAELRSLGTIDYFIDGDTHGIHEEYMYINVTAGPYTFTRKKV